MASGRGGAAVNAGAARLRPWPRPTYSAAARLLRAVLGGRTCVGCAWRWWLGAFCLCWWAVLELFLLLFLALLLWFLALLFTVVSGCALFTVVSGCSFFAVLFSRHTVVQAHSRPGTQACLLRHGAVQLPRHAQALYVFADCRAQAATSYGCRASGGALVAPCSAASLAERSCSALRGGCFLSLSAHTAPAQLGVFSAACFLSWMFSQLSVFNGSTPFSGWALFIHGHAAMLEHSYTGPSLRRACLLGLVLFIAPWGAWHVFLRGALLYSHARVRVRFPPEHTLVQPRSGSGPVFRLSTLIQPCSGSGSSRLNTLHTGPCLGAGPLSPAEHSAPGSTHTPSYRRISLLGLARAGPNEPLYEACDYTAPCSGPGHDFRLSDRLYRAQGALGPPTAHGYGFTTH